MCLGVRVCAWLSLGGCAWVCLCAQAFVLFCACMRASMDVCVRVCVWFCVHVLVVIWLTLVTRHLYQSQGCVSTRTLMKLGVPASVKHEAYACW